MKYITLIAAVVLLFFTGCQKSIITATTSSTSFEEDGHIWEGWVIHNPPSKLDLSGDKIVIDSMPPCDAVAKLSGKALPNSGPLTVYAVEPFVVGNMLNVKSNLIDERKWTLAPLSYLVALAKEYGYQYGNIYWDIYCLDVPAKINFGVYGDEDASAVLSGNTFNPYTGIQYNLSLRFSSFSYGYSGIRVLCYKK